MSQQRKAMYNALLYKKHPDLYRSRIQKTPPFNYYAIVLALLAAVIAGLAGSPHYAAVSLSLWLLLTALFSLRRLWRTSHSPTHVLEMLLTSMVIPPTALYWRLRGAIKFHVLFL